MAALLSQHLAETQQWLTAQPQITTLYMPYHDLVDNSGRQVERIAHFLRIPLDTTNMINAIDPALYRNRVGSAGQ